MKDRIRKILTGISENAFEREEAIALSLLSALSGESIFLLGLPGVGKSMIARRLKHAFVDAKVFEYLMSRFSTPDEIFGPVSISGLKDNDRYERVTQGFLPEAEVIFLDEIWKAGPAIQNSLLTVLNEKIFLNGNREMKIPAKGIIAASNELPAEGEGLEALWDRFLIRYIVKPISRKENFFRLIKDEVKSNCHRQPMPVSATEYQSGPISATEYEEIREGSRRIELPQEICELIYSVLEKLTAVSVADNENDNEDVNDIPDDEERDDLYISDRRWKKAVGVLKTSAYLNDRKTVDLTDALLLTHMLWNDDSRIPEINRILAECIVSALFVELTRSYRSLIENRGEVDRQPFSPDGRHYIIECDDYPLKISKKDYERIKSRPKDYFYGSETKGGELVINEQGQFVVRFVREGVVNINSYNYNLKSTDDYEYDPVVSREGLMLKADRLIREFEKSVKENIFTADAEALESVVLAAKVYRERFSRL